MAGKVRLSGRFSPGTRVSLIKVRDETVLRAEGGEEVDAKRVKDDGTVEFSADVGQRYFVVGRQNGFPLEVRVTGRDDSDADDATLSQAPVTPDRTRMADGSWVDEPAELDEPKFEGYPHLAQEQVKGKHVMRAYGERGSAHISDPKEPVPYGRQEDVGKGTVQMSDTETGQATPVDVSYQKQEDVPNGVWQRSATPTGLATPIPGGGPVEAQKAKESSHAKEARGEPVRAAAEPLTGVNKPTSDPKSELLATGPRTGGKEPSDAPIAESQPGPEIEEQFVGRDAQGQPVAEDLAAASGQEPAKSPAEPVRRSSKKQ
jgi:hypothetical protein